MFFWGGQKVRKVFQGCSRLTLCQRCKNYVYLNNYVYYKITSVYTLVELSRDIVGRVSSCPLCHTEYEYATLDRNVTEDDFGIFMQSYAKIFSQHTFFSFLILLLSVNIKEFFEIGATDFYEGVLDVFKHRNIFTDSDIAVLSNNDFIELVMDKNSTADEIFNKVIEERINFSKPFIATHLKTDFYTFAICRMKKQMWYVLEDEKMNKAMTENVGMLKLAKLIHKKGDWKETFKK